MAIKVTKNPDAIIPMMTLSSWTEPKEISFDAFEPKFFIQRWNELKYQNVMVV